MDSEPAVAQSRELAKSPPGRPFKRGESGNPRGKAKGTPNRVTLEVRAAASLIVDDAIYRDNLLLRARAGKLPPPVEVLLWHYAHGVPKIKLDIDARVTDVTKMATDDLRREMAELLARL